MWNPAWDDLFKQREWGKYPGLEVVRFVARRFYGASERPSVRLLDLGCGPGANLWYVAREGFDAYGIDGSVVALECARARLDKEGLKAHLHQGDISRLPYSSDYFDGVIDYECVYANNKRDSKQILSEVVRVLKPGGAFLSITFMPGSHGIRGTTLPGEPNTFTQLNGEGPESRCGIFRVTAQDEIKELYGAFELVSVDHVIRSEQSGRCEIREWVIQCRKPDRADGQKPS